MNEAVPKRQSDDTPTFDDIYVPGIGVRDALSDDSAESSDFRPGIAERCVRGAACVNRWAIRTFGNVRRVGVRLAVRLKRIETEAQTAIKRQAKFLASLTYSRDRYLEQTRRNLFNAVEISSSMYRGATKSTAASTTLLTATMTRVLQKTRSRSRQLAQITNAQLQKANKYRLSLPPVPTTVAGNLRRMRSFLSRAASSTNRLLGAANYKVLLWVSASYRPDLSTLRRAAGPLAILLVMMVFVIQQIVTVIKR